MKKGEEKVLIKATRPKEICWRWSHYLYVMGRWRYTPVMKCGEIISPARRERGKERDEICMYLAY